MQKIHYQADFTFILDLTDKAGRPMPFPSNDFRVLVETTGNVVYSAGQTGGKPFNCANEGGKIKVVVDNPGFAPGTLSITYTEHVPDASYPDGMNTITFRKVLDIALVTTGYDVPTDLSAALQLPAIRFRYEDFTAEQLASLQKPATDAANAANAKMEQFARAEGIRDRNEKVRVDAETLRTREFQTGQTNRDNAFNAAQDARAKAFATAQNERATQFDQAQTARVTAFNDAEKGRQTLFTNKETARQSTFDKAETARATAEAERVKAETARADAETKRETDFGNAKAAAETATAGAVKAEKEATAAAGEARRFVNDLLPCVEENCYYGIEWDTEVGPSECTRIGSMKLHRTLPVQSNMKGCLLADDGTEKQYLSPADWKNPKMVDGSKGQVMIKVRSHWRKFEAEGTKRRCLMSTLPLPGFVFVPTTYIGAYEAAMNRTTGQLCSVANMAADYRGGNNNSTWDGTYRDLCGRPASFINRINFRAAARKNRDNRWAAGMYYIQTMLYWLFAVEYATLNSQTPMTAELTPEGFKQGGLGTGATNLTGDEWNKFNGFYPFIPCGFTNSLGNGTGEVMYPLVGADGVTIKEVPCVRYRGIENPFGHTWMWADGINLDMDASVANGGTGITKVYVTDDHSLLNDYGFEGYTYVGDTPQYDWGTYIREFLLGDTGCLLPTSRKGGSTNIHCGDHIYIPPALKERSLRGVLCGGGSNHGASAGLACAGSHDVPATAGTSVASRLCFRA